MRIALAGDTMLGRGVADRISDAGPDALFSGEVVSALRDADLFVLNLECVISGRGERWPDPHKPFFFRAPPAAVEVLLRLGVGCVTLANNHSLDFGTEALLDTISLLGEAGIATVGAGRDLDAARAPVVVERRGTRVGIIGVTDHPAEYAAGSRRPGVAHAELAEGCPDWLLDAIGSLDADIVLVTPHWGPNMTTGPLPYIRSAAAALRSAGASLVAGHSAHVFHGVGADGTLFDLGDFIDDYAVDRRLRNDLGLLFFVDLEAGRVTDVEAMPLALDYCRTRAADPPEAEWIVQRLRAACADLGTRVREHAGRLRIEPASRYRTR